MNHLLFYVKENQIPHTYSSLNFFNFLSLHLESGQICCGTENQDAEIYFYHLFPFFHLSLTVIHREICVKDFSGLRNYFAEYFEIWYKCWVWLVVLCKRKSACCCLSFPLFPFFSFSPIKLFCHRILRGARWLSGRVSDSGARGRGFKTYRRRVLSLSKTLYSPKVLVNYPGSGCSVPTWLKNCWLGR